MKVLPERTVKLSSRAERKRSRGILWQNFAVTHQDSSISLGMTDVRDAAAKSEAEGSL